MILMILFAYYASLKDFGTSGSKKNPKQHVLVFFATLVKNFAKNLIIHISLIIIIYIYQHKFVNILI